jgi:hypothetical protein
MGPKTSQRRDCLNVGKRQRSPGTGFSQAPGMTVSSFFWVLRLQSRDASR